VVIHVVLIAEVYLKLIKKIKVKNKKSNLGGCEPPRGNA